MNALIAWWARNKIAANLAMVLIIAMGLGSFFTMEREVWPTVRANWVEVNVAWPGAAPQEVEEQLVIRIEESIQDLDNIFRIRSFARENFGAVYIEADPRIDMGEFINNVKMRVDSISTFPRDIEPPRVRELMTRNEMIRIGIHGNVDEKILKRTAERVRDEIALLPGASIVELFGTRNEEVSIELSEEAMRRYGVTFDEVAAAIRGSSINLSSGTLKTNTGDIMLRARNMADNAQDFETIIVRQTPGGGSIRVGDVARVIDGFEDVEINATLNGEDAILVQVMTTERMNVVETSESIKKWMETAQEKMPEGVKATLWHDESKIYHDRMETIGKSAFYGLIMVFIVLILTLRPVVAFWVTMGIAVSFAGTFIFLPGNDVSLNMLSLFAFLLVLGVVVDDAIVVGENIHTQSHKGHDSLTAAIVGTQLVAKPVIFAVLTTIVVFMPWMFLSGLEVQFTRQISIIVMMALLFSLVESLLILPAHLSKMKPRKQLGRFSTMQKKIADSITGFAEKTYRPIAIKIVKYRYRTVTAFFMLFMVSIGLVSSGWLKFTFMPEIESEQIQLEVALPDGTPFNRALEVLTQLQDAEQQLVAEIDGLEGDQKLVANWYTRARPNNVLAIVQLVPSEERALSAKEAGERLRELTGDIPDAEEINLVYTIDSQGPGFQYSVNAQNLDELRAAVDDFKAKLLEYPALYDVRDNLTSSTDEIQMSLKPGAEKLGLTLRDVSRQVRQAYYGEEVQRLPREGDDVRVMVRYPKSSRNNIDSLNHFRVRTSDGREVPLLSVVDITYSPGINRIDRRERMRSAVISADLKDEVRREITKDLEDNFIPEWEKRHPNASLGVVGQAEGEALFMQEVLQLEGLALFVMYILIAVAFKSYWEPIIIMMAIPFAFMGAVFGHIIFGANMALFSYFGIAAAVGVVVNDNIVLVDYLKRLRGEKGGELHDVIVEAGVARFRAILLTSVTTFVGLMPMMFERSLQAQFLKPAVISLSFGVLFALFVTLLLVPALYGVSEDMSVRWLSLKGRIKALFVRKATTLIEAERPAGE